MLPLKLITQQLVKQKVIFLWFGG